MAEKDKKRVEEVEERNPNLEIYDKVCKVPAEAIKQIGAGRLKGMSDINPMWRIKCMTEVFGICGIGWKYEVTKQWTETFGNEIKGFCNINLYIKMNGEWSEPIFGTGGSSFVTQESRGIYVNDEVFKMALTDALSVAMKALGVGASVYYAKDADYSTKYSYDEQKGNGSLPASQNLPNNQSSQTNGYTIPSNTDKQLEAIIYNIRVARTQDELMHIWTECSSYQSNHLFTSELTKRKNEINGGIKQK